MYPEILHRRQAAPARHNLCNAIHSCASSSVRSVSRSVDCADRGEGHTPQRSHRRTGQQARAYRTVHPHVTRNVLSSATTSTVGFRSRVKVYKRAIETAHRHSVSPRQKNDLGGQSTYSEPSAHIPSWPCRQKRLTRERPDTSPLRELLVRERPLTKSGRPIHFCQTILDCFAEKLVLHSLLAQHPLQFANLLERIGQFRCRNDFLTGLDR